MVIGAFTVVYSVMYSLETVSNESGRIAPQMVAISPACGNFSITAEMCVNLEHIYTNLVDQQPTQWIFVPKAQKGMGRDKQNNIRNSFYINLF